MNKIINAIIIEDEHEPMKYLLDLIEKYHSHVKILTTCKTYSDAKEHILSYKPDLLFLDIRLLNENSFDLLKDIKSKDYFPYIIFTTAYEEYAVQAFKHNTIDYLLKPIDPTELKNAIDKLDMFFDKINYGEKVDLLFSELKRNITICINSRTGYSLINTNEIFYCESESTYTIVHLISGSKKVVCKTLNKFFKELPQPTFKRISRFNIINMDFLKEVKTTDHTCLLKTDNSETKLTYSKRYFS